MLVEITDDFDLAKITDSGQCFRVRRFDNGTYRFLTGRHILYIRHIADYQYHVDCTMDEWQEIWFPYFDLNRSYSLVRSQIAEGDSYMKNAAEEGAGLRILRQDPWEMLITFIISQQKNIPAIKSCVEKIAGMCGDTLDTAYETVHIFPSAAQIAAVTEEELSQCKLGYRTPYILDAVAKTVSGQLDLSSLYICSDIQLFNTLKSVHGVGDKVANCIALFAYGRTSLVPVDTWIKKVIDTVYGGHNPFPTYGNEAGIMQQYIFYYAQQNKKSF